MSKLVNVLMIGESGSGKGHLLKFIEDPRTAKFSSRPLDVNHVAVYKNANEVFYFWDTTISKSGYDCKHPRVLMYCVDLSKELSDERQEQIITEIEQNKKKYPAAAIYLVGTKQDAALVQTLTAFELLRENKCVDFSTDVSVKSKINTSPLREELFKLAVVELNAEEEEQRQKLLSDIDTRIMSVLRVKTHVMRSSFEMNKKVSLLGDIDTRMASLLELQTQASLTPFKVVLDKLQAKFDAMKLPEIPAEKRDRFFSSLTVDDQQSAGSNAPASSSY